MPEENEQQNEGLYERYIGYEKEQLGEYNENHNFVFYSEEKQQEIKDNLERHLKQMIASWERNGFASCFKEKHVIRNKIDNLMMKKYHEAMKNYSQDRNMTNNERLVGLESFAAYGAFAKIEKDNQEAQINIMLSQIQPHFLYNTLSSIIGICDDPKMTKKAITDFAKYLRVNLDSLKRENPIPVLQEIDPVKNYVNLEKLRFGDRLNVIYDIQSTDFKIPPLTIQMLVENSIKHGITKRECGGCVHILTKDDEYYFYIIVSDDGIGFNQNYFDLNRSHVGLNNLSSRLQLFVNGSLSITSKENEGTNVTIRIPKGGK